MYCSFKTGFGAVKSLIREVYFHLFKQSNVLSRSCIIEERKFFDHVNAVARDDEIIRKYTSIAIVRAFTQVKTK